MLFVEDGGVRFTGTQNSNIFNISSVMSSSTAGAELNLAGFPDSMENEVINITVNPQMNGMRTWSKIGMANCWDWYQPNGTGTFITDLAIDLESRSFAHESDINEVKGNTYTITLSWHNLSAKYIVKFADDYHVQ